MLYYLIVCRSLTYAQLNWLLRWIGREYLPIFCVRPKQYPAADAVTRSSCPSAA